MSSQSSFPFLQHLLLPEENACISYLEIAYLFLLLLIRFCNLGFLPNHTIVLPLQRTRSRCRRHKVRFGRRRGRPRKIRNPSDVIDSEPLSVDKTCSNLGTESRFDDSGITTMDPNSSNRKRGRPRKSGDGFNQLISEDKDEIVNFENREGTMVDLFALANYEEDPYGEELRRMTVGLKTNEEFSGFLQQLNGEWVNAGKKKKVVQA